MRPLFFLILVGFLFIQLTDVLASGAVARRRQGQNMQQQQQQAEQQAIEQAMVQQYQQQMQQAQQQAMEQQQMEMIMQMRQAQMEAAAQQIIAQVMAQKQEEAAYQMMAQVVAQQQQAAAQQMVAQVQQAQMEQAAAQQMAGQIQQAQMQQVAAQQMVAQAQEAQVAYAYANQMHQGQQIVYKNTQDQAIAQALAEQYQQAIVEEAVKQNIVLTAAQMAQARQLAQAQAEVAAVEAIKAKQQMQALETAAVGPAAMKNRPFEEVAAEDIKDVVDITDVWRKLDKESRSWALLIDNQAKVATVSEYIDRFGKQGVRIQLPPIDYVNLIDEMATQNPSLLLSPFKDIVQLAAIMQYDFDNGMDKDTLAKKMLGEQFYLSNKKRLGK